MSDATAAYLVNAVLVITLIEAAVLMLWHRLTGRGVPPREFALNLVSGLCLMVTLRAALADAAWPWIAAGLAAAGMAHAADLWRRWPRRPRPS